MIDVTYLSVEDLNELTSISQNIDVNYLNPYIKSSEAMFVSPVLGTALDTELKSAITGNTLTGNNYTLVQYYIKPLSAYSSFLSALPFLSMKLTSKGVQRQSSDSSQIASIEELNYLRQSIKDTQSFYKDQLVDYLEANQSIYPNYRTNCNNNSGSNNSNGIYLGNY